MRSAADRERTVRTRGRRPSVGCAVSGHLRRWRAAGRIVPTVAARVRLPKRLEPTSTQPTSDGLMLPSSRLPDGGSLLARVTGTAR